MKQYIDFKQWNSISSENKTRFWRSVTIPCNNHDAATGSDKCTCSNPSIGQMIEFLDRRKDPEESSWDDRFENRRIDEVVTKGNLVMSWNGELCDALFEAVKEILESSDGK